MKLADLGLPLAGKRYPRAITGRSEGYICDTCRQWVEKSDLKQVMYHAAPDHEPLEKDS